MYRLESSTFMTVEKYRFINDFDLVAGETNTSLDEVTSRIFGKPEYNDVTPSQLLIRKKEPLGSSSWTRPKINLLTRDVIADKKVLFHRAGWNFEGLNNIGSGERGKDHRNQQRFEIFAHKRLRRFH